MSCLLGSVSSDSDALLNVLPCDQLFVQFIEVNCEKLSCLIESFVVVLYWIWWKRIMSVVAEGEEGIELKFRIFDGTDIGHSTYPALTTVSNLKQMLVSQWPQGKSVMPKSVSDIKLIHAGKVLENSKTLAESTVHIGDFPGNVITMHVVVQPPVAKKKTDKKEKTNQCSCTIL